MWCFLEWQGKGEWWGGGHSVARVSHHPHPADFFRQSILWLLLVLTVTWLAHQESPGLPWLLGSCPSLVAEMTHIQLQHKVRGGVCHWGSIYWVLWGIRKNRWLLAGTERKGKGGEWKSRVQCSGPGGEGGLHFQEISTKEVLAQDCDGFSLDLRVLPHQSSVGLSHRMPYMLSTQGSCSSPIVGRGKNPQTSVFKEQLCRERARTLQRSRGSASRVSLRGVYGTLQSVSWPDLWNSYAIIKKCLSLCG